MPKLNIIKDILDQRNIPMAEFCREINMSVSGFKRIIEKNSTRIQTLELIAEALNCPVGMFFDGYETGERDGLKGRKSEFKPHIPVMAHAGGMAGVADGFTGEGCETMPVLSAWGNYDFTIEVKGDSMLPEYKSGDVIACKRMNRGEDIHFGSVYVLDTAQGVALKQVERYRQDPMRIQCVSFNKNYEPYTVALEEVFGMSLVVGVLKSV